MKTPTLIVRLIGLYLTINCTIGLMQIHDVLSMTGPNSFGAQQQSIFTGIKLLMVAGLVVGIIATLFAGMLARLLTFDAGATGDN